MAGGTFTVQNKVRPGAYINFKSAGKPLGTLADRGIMTMPLALKWGPSKTPIEITAETDVQEVLGYSLLDPELLLIKEAAKRASKILLYRLNDGTKATATVEPLTITARYGGTRGNAISVTLTEDVDAEGTFKVVTLLDGRPVHEQLGKKVEDLENNHFVTFSGTGALAASSGAPLTNGTDTEAETQSYLDYFKAIEVLTWNTMAIPTKDSTVKGAAVSFIKRMREEEGKKVQGVLENYPTADYEGIISVKNGVKLTDGTIIDAVKATAWVAAATAGAEVNQSNTYTTYDDSVDVDVRYTNTQIIEALQKGEFVFVEQGGKAVVEQDINTLTSFTADKDKSFRKNRVIRVLDAIGNDINTIFSQYYLGSTDNHADGRKLFKGECINYLDTLQGISAIQNFDSTKDVEVLPGQESDAVVTNIYVQPVDSMEKLYMTVTVR
nr:MAG TPA: tail sheath protein [Caudoviricetes sp.]